MTGKYSKAVRKYLPSTYSEWSEEQIYLNDHAEDIDRLLEESARISRNLAQKFTEYAAVLEAGLVREAPTAWSMNDLMLAAGRLQAKQESFRTLARTVLGHADAQQLVQSLLKSGSQA